jgi:hypothetical protein
MDELKGNPLSHIKKLFRATTLLVSIAIAVTFSHDVHGQTSKPISGKEVNIDYQKMMIDAIESSIKNATSFPITITYPDRDILLAK